MKHQGQITSEITSMVSIRPPHRALGFPSLSILHLQAAERPEESSLPRLPRVSVSKVGGKFRTTEPFDASIRISSSSVHGRAPMSRFPLTPDQAALSDRIYQSLRQAAETDLRTLADLLASKPDHQLLGQTEFEVRDHVHKIGAKALETALDERKKGGTKGPA
jgi:hypothetical protein